MSRRLDPQFIETPGPLETPCWVWQGRPDVGGYGRLRDGGGLRQAHVVFYERRCGPVPDGLVLDHLCSVPRCVNPDHLEAVTQVVNVRRSRVAKFTVDDVAQIRADYAAGRADQPTLAARYGVTQQAVSLVIRRKTWADVAPAHS